MSDMRLGDYGAPVASSLWGDADVVGVRDGVVERGRYVHPPLVLVTPDADLESLRGRWVDLHGDWGQEHAALLRVGVLDGVRAGDMQDLMEPIARAASYDMELRSQTAMAYPLTVPRCFVFELRAGTDPAVVGRLREWHTRTISESGLDYPPLVVVGHLALPLLSG